MTQPASRAFHTELLNFADHVANRVDQGAVSQRVTPAAARAQIDERFDLSGGASPESVLRQVEDVLRRFSVHVIHRRYFGLFNPSVLPEAVAAAALVAAYNPQEAVWSHAPGAVEMEQRALAHLAERIGWSPRATAAHFTSGGQEANLVALTVALAHRFPSWREGGVRALDALPVLYVAGEGHHSFVKAARVAGLGDAAVRWVGVDEAHRMDVDQLVARIADDRAAGLAPLAVVGTAGTTATGAIDPLTAIGTVCRREGLWFHCDAAWGGGALMSDAMRRHLDGIEAADSVTWDAHKWLSTPMGAGTFLCRHREALIAAFEVVSGYMPVGRVGADDPHRTTLQWSRRAAGVPLLAALATRGISGYGGLIEGQARMGDALRQRLEGAGYELLNQTPLPLVCFSHPRIRDAQAAADVARAIVDGGRAWISTVVLPDQTRALRACITSYRTTEADLDVLIDELDRAVAA